MCEWASIDRLERGTRGGRLAALRAAVAAQAIVTFDDALQVPRDLADVPVLVQELTGSHYTTLQMLEGALGRARIKIAAGGLPQTRWQALKDGAFRAVTVMEPFISLALKEGAHIIAAEFYRGGEVVAPHLTPEQRKAYYDAENVAVDRINADFYRYAHHVAAQAKGALAPRELLRAFVHYKHVETYDLALFDRTYEWMKSGGLTEGASAHGTLWSFEEDYAMTSPVKLSHYVLQTNQIPALRAFYLAVLGGEIVHENPHLCYNAYDDEHHRIAFVDFEQLRKKTDKDVGLHHVAFTFVDLHTLLETWERLKQHDAIAPFWCINHGPTTSLYYHDPDGNGVELQVDNFADVADCKAFMQGPEFAANPLGVEFDPGEMLRRLRAGAPARSFMVRAELADAMA